MIQDSLVCVDDPAFDLQCLPVKELIVPSRFKQLLEIRAVHVHIDKSLRLATPGRWENVRKGPYPGFWDPNPSVALF